MENTNSIKDFLNTKKCTPLIAYFLIILISIVMIMNSKNAIDKINKTNNNHKLFNVFKLFTYYELSFILVLGIILLGLCQHNKDTLAWICLMFSLLCYLIKNIIVFLNLYSIQKNEPKESEKSEKSEKKVLELPMTIPTTNNVMESQQQMLQFNQALQNNALQNNTVQNNPLQNASQNNASQNVNINQNDNTNTNINTNMNTNMNNPLTNMNDPLTNIYGNNNNLSDSMPMPTNFNNY